MRKFNTYTKPLLGLFLAAVLFACQNNTQETEVTAFLEIEKAIIKEKDSFFYINSEAYQISPDLPIGFFDSGTGGLTILNSVMEFDGFDNASKTLGSDGIPDFSSEKFIYLADQANMPYGNYYAEKNSDLLLEHIIKDAQFLFSQNYYLDQNAKEVNNDKQKVKAIVIACNTATAYGKEALVEFTQKAKLPVKIIGVIDAGAKGALEKFNFDEDGSIAVFATVGTIASKGYENTILEYKKELGYTGDIQVFNQGGHGLAEAVDQEADYILPGSAQPRKNYRGPELNHQDFPIYKTLMDVYNFDFDHGKMLCDSNNIEDCDVMQINSTENYVRYHLVSMMEKIRASKDPQPLKVILLGCTHYPYLENEMRAVLKELYEYQDEEGYRYKHLMSSKIEIVDPALNVAEELFQFLNENDLLNPDGKIADSEFYISVPNLHNANVVTEGKLNFTYEYKYGRKAGEIQEYVKIVPFTKSNISEDTFERLEKSVPTVYRAIGDFHGGNEKLISLPKEILIK